MDGALLLTERVRSFIQFISPAGLIPMVSSTAVPVREDEKPISLPIHEKICGNSIKRNGMKKNSDDTADKYIAD